MKPCGYCGDGPKLHIDYKEGIAWVSCDNEKCPHQPSTHNYTGHEFEALASEQWNNCEIFKTKNKAIVIKGAA